MSFHASIANPSVSWLLNVKPDVFIYYKLILVQDNNILIVCFSSEEAFTKIHYFYKFAGTQRRYHGWIKRKSPALRINQRHIAHLSQLNGKSKMWYRMLLIFQSRKAKVSIDSQDPFSSPTDDPERPKSVTTKYRRPRSVSTTCQTQFAELVGILWWAVKIGWLDTYTKLIATPWSSLSYSSTCKEAWQIKYYFAKQTLPGNYFQINLFRHWIQWTFLCFSGCK